MVANPMKLIHRFENEFCIVDIQGELDYNTIPQFEAYFKELPDKLETDVQGILINLADVEYISSIGYGSFLSTIVNLKDGNRAVAVFRANTIIAQSFQVFDANNIIELYDNELEALDKLKSA